jgi:thiol:disulfide interchange protein DsbC
MRYDGRLSILTLLAVLALSAGSAYGFGALTGACETDCRKCHQLTRKEAVDLIKKVNPDVDVIDVKDAPVRGLWEVVVEAKEKKGIAYVDFSKKHLITGSILEVDTKENLTGKRLYEVSKVDVSSIPLDDALVMGKRDAKYKVVVFDDPD